ncbi:hypothetical protein [Alkalimarinus sediminis]|uniref:Uncharacterized protein n=1 Tax=Alkalimarinus sediminis TaxID=1632866 RepID=A0A9E8HG86_9ALTE|nr:hypothetical protein [Alkalimarinus sediminis]UZW73660.1 hypothetical protein NNL22_11485 [Alkalimarinus sediminis]
MAFSETYRNHTLVASFEGDVCVGKVFNKKTQVAYCEADGWAQAEQHLRLIVDNDIEKKCQHRGAAPVLFEELKSGLEEIKAYLEPRTISMLRHHYQADQGVLSLERLAKLGQCSNTTDVYFIYAAIARCLCDELAYMPPSHHNGRDPMISMLIKETEYGPVGQNGVEIILETEIKRALIELQW